jgi:hypothetical protein
LERRSNNKHKKEDLKLPVFDLDTLACATDNFSVDNKLGEGGFGSVYKVLICKQYLDGFQIHDINSYHHMTEKGIPFGKSSNR